MSPEFDNILDLAKQKGFYTYEYMSYFEKFKEQLSSREKFCSSLTGKNISDKEYQHALKVWNNFATKTMNDYYDLHLKYDALLLADIFKKSRNNS